MKQNKFNLIFYCFFFSLLLAPLFLKVERLDLFLIIFFQIIGGKCIYWDIKNRIIFFKDLLSLFILGVIWFVTHQNSLEFLLVFFFFLFLLFSSTKEKIGVGDIILLAICGLFIKTEMGFSYLILLTGLIGIMTSFLLKKEKKIPLAPAIIFSTGLLMILQ